MYCPFKLPATMADLTLQELFGDSVTYNNANKQITFNLEEIAGQDFNTNNVTKTNCDKCASKILWALLHHVKNNQPNTNNDPERGIYITNQGSRRITRDGVNQFAYQLVINGYTPDPMTNTLATDDLVMIRENNNA